MNRMIARLWRAIRGPMQWRVPGLAHAKFIIGVTGIVRDHDGHVLLLHHRLWPEGRQWGLPTGYAKAGESFQDTIIREVREETGLDIAVGELARLRSGYRLRAEVAYEAVHTGGNLKLSVFEILDARWFSPDALPAGVLDAHLDLIPAKTRRMNPEAAHGPPASAQRATRRKPAKTVRRPGRLSRPW